MFTVLVEQGNAHIKCAYYGALHATHRGTLPKRQKRRSSLLALNAFFDVAVTVLTLPLKFQNVPSLNVFGNDYKQSV